MIDHMAPQKDWIDVLSALLTPTIAILGIYIAFRQWLTNKNNIKFNLFDKRYIVFENIKKFIASILSSGRVEDGADIQFLRDTKSVAFLFDDEIAKKLHALIKTEKTSTDEQLQQNLDKQDEIKCWFQEQLNDIDKIFKKYLKLKH